MDIVILGATGFSGSAVLDEALRRGHRVTVLVRDRRRWHASHANLRVEEGDALDPLALARVLQGQEAVIQCLGVGGKGDGKPNTFLSDVTRLLVAEMERQGVRRLIAMSNTGAGNSIAFMPRFFTRFILPWFMRWLQAIIDDKNRMEPLIMNSALAWTIVRCPNITDRPAKGTCLASLDGKGLKLSITRQDMARFMVDQCTDGNYLRQAPSISN